MELESSPGRPALPAVMGNGGSLVQSGRPWSFWLTVAIGFGVMTLFGGAQVLSSIIMVVTIGSIEQRDPEEFLGNMEAYMLDSRVLSFSMLYSFIVLILATLGFVALKKGISFREYLSLQKMSWMWWVILPIVTAAFSFSVGWLLQRVGAPEENEWMKQMGEVSKGSVFMWIGIVLLAPVAEETFFRGFLFQGMSKSALGIWGAIFMTSLWFAVIHMQYDVFGFVFIFALGVLMAIARWKVGSLYAPILIHMVNNALAMIAVTVE